MRNGHVGRMTVSSSWSLFDADAPWRKIEDSMLKITQRQREGEDVVTAILSTISQDMQEVVNQFGSQDAGNTNRSVQTVRQGSRSRLLQANLEYDLMLMDRHVLPGMGTQTEIENEQVGTSLPRSAPDELLTRNAHRNWDFMPNTVRTLEGSGVSQQVRRPRGGTTMTKTKTLTSSSGVPDERRMSTDLLSDDSARPEAEAEKASSSWKKWKSKSRIRLPSMSFSKAKAT